MSGRTIPEWVPFEAVRDQLPNTRREFERSFDRTVEENRFTIAVVFPTVGALLLVASAEGLLPDPLAFNPWLLLVGVAVMRSPLVAGVAPLVDRRAGAWLGLLVAYTYAIEHVGVRTGWPYGYFEYGVSLGPMLGGVPLALPLFFIPLVANAYLLCLLLLGTRANSTPIRLATVIGFVIAMDAVLDPGAVAIGFWGYDGGGIFYDVPLSNYAGWVLSATVAVVSLDRAFDRAGLLSRLNTTPFMLDDMVSFVILWGGINVWFGNPVPAILAAAMAAGLIATDRFDSELLWPWRD
ncbi:carotene biosynthesis associated membrane protein [Halalkaliarchaeum desulfuricum]|uniref:Carotene biosynthesis associated membrane protein n=1 Tax=Halalkaliarchaeum desulfuricum TaxID=2055893 RepID=A0A343TIB4_9EURY|nr:bisanhydrobacterioruberin hydratase [Halalkaliarchaeum desulfuricum]AUX08836.1 carotene biosynthesis associated membrane protein [Halalkaliarchaeum desulfuricum]